jgi:hypothetical protein
MNIKLLRTIFLHINILLVKMNFNKERYTLLVLTNKGLGTGRKKKVWSVQFDNGRKNYISLLSISCWYKLILIKSIMLARPRHTRCNDRVRKFPNLTPACPWTHTLKILIDSYVNSFTNGSAALLAPGRFSKLVILYTVCKIPWTGDQHVASPLSTHRTAWIRTHDPSFRKGEDSSCLWPHGHCDRPYVN